MTISTEGAAPPRWGRDTEEAVINGFPVRRYRERPLSVNQLLLEARRWKDRELLVQGDRRLSYRQHESAVAAVANRLSAYGVSRGDRVLIVGFNSIEWFVSFWAIQALGAVAVLGNPWWNDTQIEEMVVPIQPTLTITDRKLSNVARIKWSEIRGIVDAGVPTRLQLAELSEHDPSVIMFTSGTTGLPKAILMPQRSIIGNLQNLLSVSKRLPSELPDSYEGTTSMQSVPLFHLAGVQVSCATILQGGKLVLLDGRFDPAEVLRLIEQEQVKSWGAVPTMVARVLDHPDITTRDISSLQSIPLGGSPVPDALRDRIDHTFTNVRKRVGSLYGLTETGGLLAAASGSEIAGHPGRVGRPLPVVELKIESPDATGSGEIFARTPNVPDEFIGVGPIADSDGWIGTGDLGYIDDEGYLCVTGRAKEIIIRGGENISAPMVEEALLAHPAIADCAVIALPDDDLGEIVGAVLLTMPGSMTPTIEDLTAIATARLSRHEVPQRWWFRDEPMPMSVVGKMDKKTLRQEWLDRGAENIGAPVTSI